MSIDFYCARCHSFLRVPDEIGGRKAQCPHCGDIQAVPTESMMSQPPMDAQPIPSLDSPPSQPQAFQLPYAQSQLFSPTAELVSTRPGFSAMFQNTWDIFSARIGDFIMVGLVMAGILLLFSGPSFALSFFLELTQRNEAARNQYADFLIPLFALRVCFDILGGIVNCYLQLGGIRYAIHLARGRESRLSLMFPGFGLFLKNFVATILVAIVAWGAMAIFLVPGFAIYFFSMQGQVFQPIAEQNIGLLVGIIIISFLIALPVLMYISVRLGWFVCFLADREEGPLEAIQSSIHYTRGNVLSLLALMIAYGVIGFFIALCTCNIGYIVAFPLFQCYFAVAYLMMTGQPLVNPARIR